jgi:hypothetical protein
VPSKDLYEVDSLFNNFRRDDLKLRHEGNGTEVHP